MKNIDYLQVTRRSESTCFFIIIIIIAFYDKTAYANSLLGK